MKDTFGPKCIDVGELTHIIVRKAETMTLGGDWHLQEVEIWHPGVRYPAGIHARHHLPAPDGCPARG